MSGVLKTAPAVFAVGKDYQITVLVKKETVMWVKVGDKCYYDDSNGILRSAKGIHKMTVPASELDKAGKYTVCYREIIKRKPYFSKTKPLCCEDFEFYPVKKDEINVYQIADAHNTVDLPVACAKRFEEEKGKLDFLILNGDVPEDSGRIKNFDNIYEIISQITGGNIPVVFSRGNHDTRGIYAESIAEYTPCENGNSFFTFRAGSIWGVVIDCGEDKPDSHEEYGNMVCCEAFRERETKFIEGLSAKADTEYNAPGVEHKIVVAHTPFTRKNQPPFDIEEERYTYWAKLLKETVQPEVMLCGHTHEYSVDMPGCENDAFGQPCPVVVGSKVNKRNKEFAGSGFVFKKNSIEIIFNDADKITETHELRMEN